MEDKFSGEGLHVLGFLSNDFGNQGGSQEEIEACKAQYALKFQQFELDHVVGAQAQPVYAWLESQPDPGPAATLAPTWNFHKYLVSRDGKLVASWDTPLYPGDDPQDPNDSFDGSPIVIAIKAELAKKP